MPALMSNIGVAVGLKKKDSKEARVTTMRLDDLGQSMTLESNKSLVFYGKNRKHCKINNDPAKS